MKRIYLDYSATTPVDPIVQHEIDSVLKKNYGNPSSIHWHGRQAKNVLEDVRFRIAHSLNAQADEIYFTSGGTESDNYALMGTYLAQNKPDKNHLIVSAVEHHAILHTAERLHSLGANVTIVPVESNGIVNTQFIRQAIRPETFLISIMYVNNEIGTIQPLPEIIECAKEQELIIHTDAIQAVGKFPIDLALLKVDLLSISAHKFYGPKGIGILFIRKGTNIKPLLYGGGQEANRRPGTENLPYVVGMAKALELSISNMKTESARLHRLKKIFITKLKENFSNILFNGEDAPAIPNVLNISFDSAKQTIDGDALILGLDLEGVSVTSGSACTSGSLQPSHVLLAMGRDVNTARATIRFSIGRWTTEDDVIYAVNALKKVVSKISSKKNH